MKTLLFDNSYPLTSPFGTRTLNGHTHFHDGVDFGTPIGTPLKAPRAGVVHTAGVVDNFNPESPNLGVLVRMDNGLFFTMFHMSRIDVRVGQRVEVGQVVGLSGNTGFTTGPHVHFGVYQQPWRNPIDPMPYITLPNQTIINPKKNTMDESQIRFIQGNGGSPLSKELLVNAILKGDTEYFDLYYPAWIEELKQEAINPLQEQVEELEDKNIELQKVAIKLTEANNPIATKSQNSLQVEKDVNENAETLYKAVEERKDEIEAKTAKLQVQLDNKASGRILGVSKKLTSAITAGVAYLGILNSLPPEVLTQDVYGLPISIWSGAILALLNGAYIAVQGIIDYKEKK